MSTRDEIATTEGALTGAALAAAASWKRYDDDRNRRLQSLTGSTTAVTTAFRDFQVRGDVLRSQMPVVQDAQAGLSVANQIDLPPTLTPTAVNFTRPDLAKDREELARKMSFPPNAGVYTDQGMIEKVGELAALFTGLTFQEVRAAVQGLIQHKEPIGDQKVQISRAFHALNYVLYSTNLTLAQFIQIWTTLFAGNTTSPPGGGGDPHSQLTTPPMITFKDSNIQSVTPLGLPDLAGYSYPHANYDRASKFRIMVGSTPMPANTVVLQVGFGTPWTKNGQPYAPVVTTQNSAGLLISQVTPSSFSVFSSFLAAPATSIDIGFAASGG